MLAARKLLGQCTARWVLGAAASLLGAAGAAGCEEAAAKARLCEEACDALIRCDVLYDHRTCTLGCQASLVFARCAEDAVGDCDTLAMCALEQSSADNCGGSSGVPRGNDSCEEVSSCQGTCSITGLGAPCACACQAKLAPESALQLLINNQCAIAHCPGLCSLLAPPSPACVMCYEASCEDEKDQCSDDVPESSDSRMSDPAASDSGAPDSSRQGAGPADSGATKK